MSLGERFEDIKFLLRDRGPDFTASFDAVFRTAGARILRAAVQAQHLAPRDPRPLLILGEAHLHTVLIEYQVHYNMARPHQGISQRVPDDEPGHPWGVMYCPVPAGWSGGDLLWPMCAGPADGAWYAVLFAFWRDAPGHDMKTHLAIERDTLGKDAVAGLVLGVESVPDGLAAGLLAGVSPLSGLYAYLFGTVGGSLFTGSAFMAVQATGAMAIVIADVTAVHSASDQARALFTLSVLTGVVMLAAGLLRLGSVLRFVSNAVMTGFISAVGVNIILGQLANLTGYKAEGANRVVRAINTVIRPNELHLQSLAAGLVTIALILLLERTRLGPLGLVLAVIITSAGVAVLDWSSVAVVGDLSAIPRALPVPVAPVLRLVPPLILPALSLAFVGLIQGAAISAAFPNPDGRYPDSSRDFIGQGAANVIAGIFRGMPVGGSMSATSLNKAAGARSRLALVIAGVVIAVVILAFAGLVGHIAMPALAGLLILVGFRTIKPDDLASVWKTGPVQKTVLVVTFTLTMLIPLQYAVLAGVGLSMILHVVRQSNRVTIRRQVPGPDGTLIETDPPAELPAGEVVVLQPYGSLFFAAAPAFESQLPAVASASGHSVVIVRLRGRTDLGTTFMQVLCRYGAALTDAGSKLVLVSASKQIQDQLRAAGVTDVIGPQDIYAGDERVGATVRRAYADGTAWIQANQRRTGTGTPGDTEPA